jgi:hypothetical protein
LSSSDSFAVQGRYQEDGLFGYSWPFSVGVKYGSNGDVLSYVNDAGNFSDRGFYLNGQYLGSSVVFPISFVGGNVTIIPQASPSSQVFFIYFFLVIFLHKFYFNSDGFLSIFVLFFFHVFIFILLIFFFFICLRFDIGLLLTME